MGVVDERASLILAITHLSSCSFPWIHFFSLLFSSRSLFIIRAKSALFACFSHLSRLCIAGLTQAWLVSLLTPLHLIILFSCKTVRNVSKFSSRGEKLINLIFDS